MREEKRKEELDGGSAFNDYSLKVRINECKFSIG